jgi:hypothetical protein
MTLMHLESLTGDFVAMLVSVGVYGIFHVYLDLIAVVS